MEYTDKDLERFWDKVDKSGDCWVWNSQLRNDYGIFRLAGKIVSAHRLSFLIANGTIDNNLQVRHTCDNPPCVRPDHLIQGTRKQNSRDMLDRDRGLSELTNSQVEDMRSRKMTITIVSELSEEFGVTSQTIMNALTGGTFSHLSGAVNPPRQKAKTKLTIEQVKEIKTALLSPWWGQVNHLANKYGVNHSEISHIKLGYVHKSVTLD